MTNLFNPTFKRHTAQVDKFFSLSTRPNIYKFKLPTNLLIGFLNYNIIQTFSNHINFAQTQNLEQVDHLLDNFNTNGWPRELSSLRILQKIIWILKDLDDTNTIDTPFQLIKSKTGYMCHPGSSRLIIACYLRPTEFIEGFYVWNKKLDQEPIIFLGETTELYTSKDFFDLFNFEKYFFKFRTQKISNKIKKGLESVVVNALHSHNTIFSDQFITFYDNYNIRSPDDFAYQRKRYNFKLNDNIKFIDSETCQFYNITLKKENDLWIKI